MQGLYEKQLFCAGANLNKMKNFSFIDFLDDHCLYFSVSLLY